MKMRYIWDMWDGVGKLPDGIHTFVIRDGSQHYVKDYELFSPDSTHTGEYDDIISYCVAVQDLTGEDYE
jgi:hypothetical protein